MYKRIICIIMVFVLFGSVMDRAYSQEENDSSAVSEINMEQPTSGIVSNADWMKIEYAANMMDEERKFTYEWVRPMIKGVVLTYSQKTFRERPAVFQEQHFNKEDYAVALLPLAVNWTLKLTGVKSKSSLKRMVTANTMALAMHVGLTKGLKTVVDETRPNGVDDMSCPSGHTSLAFLSASVLSREYGHISPWITVGSYGCASATQLLRQRHNNHWINDTFLGAGIGILSANLAYYLTDKLYGMNEIHIPEVRIEELRKIKNMNMNPSGIKFMMGTESWNKTIGKEDLSVLADYTGEVCIKTGAAYTVGVDASWYLTPLFAVEALARMSSAHAKVSTPAVGSGDYSGDSFTMYHLGAAAKFSIPFKENKRVGYRALIGIRSNRELTLDSYSYDTSGSIKTEPYVRVPGHTNFEVGAGMTYDILNSKNYSVGFVLDYYHTFTSLMPDRLIVASSWKQYF